MKNRQTELDALAGWRGVGKLVLTVLKDQVFDVQPLKGRLMLQNLRYR
jgi:hypothetical protein